MDHLDISKALEENLLYGLQVAADVLVAFLRYWDAGAMIAAVELEPAGIPEKSFIVEQGFSGVMHGRGLLVLDQANREKCNEAIDFQHEFSTFEDVFCEIANNTINATLGTVLNLFGCKQQNFVYTAPSTVGADKVFVAHEESEFQGLITIKIKTIELTFHYLYQISNSSLEDFAKTMRNMRGQAKSIEQSDDLLAIRDFLTESMPYIEKIENALLMAAGNREEDEEPISEILRNLHSLKGNASFGGFTEIEELVHKMEGFLQEVHDERHGLTVGHTNEAMRMSLDIHRKCIALSTAVSDTRYPTQLKESSKLGEAIGSSKISIETSVLAELEKKSFFLSQKIKHLSSKLKRAGVVDNDLDLQGIYQLSLQVNEIVNDASRKRVKDALKSLYILCNHAANETGKKVGLEINSHSEFLDRFIVDALRSPLAHLVRNAIDHGIENEAVRVAKGKDPTGKIILDISDNERETRVFFRDDGGGIDVDSVQRKALEVGLITPEWIARMQHHEVLELIFDPGFSTRDEVTTISGRGIGMDVVKHNIERLGGEIFIDSRKDVGTSFHIIIPKSKAKKSNAA